MKPCFLNNEKEEHKLKIEEAGEEDGDKVLVQLLCVCRLMPLAKSWSAGQAGCVCVCVCV